MPELVTTQAVSLAEELWYNALPIGKFYDHRYGEINHNAGAGDRLGGKYGEGSIISSTGSRSATEMEPRAQG